MDWTYDAMRFLHKAMGNWSHVPHDMKETESESFRDITEEVKKGQ